MSKPGGGVRITLHQFAFKFDTQIYLLSPVKLISYSTCRASYLLRSKDGRQLFYLHGEIERLFISTINDLMLF